jgi:hypothetical protein
VRLVTTRGQIIFHERVILAGAVTLAKSYNTTMTLLRNKISQQLYIWSDKNNTFHIVEVGKQEIYSKEQLF